jgi:hypothetical protein
MDLAPRVGPLLDVGPPEAAVLADRAVRGNVATIRPSP